MQNSGQVLLGASAVAGSCCGPSPEVAQGAVAVAGRSCKQRVVAKKMLWGKGKRSSAKAEPGPVACAEETGNRKRLPRDLSHKGHRQDVPARAGRWQGESFGLHP